MHVAERNIPTSPNWFLSHASDANETGVYAFAARMNVFVMDVSVPSAGPRMLGYFSGHGERVTAVALSPLRATEEISGPAEEKILSASADGENVDLKNVLLEGLMCCSGSDDKTVRIWRLDGMTEEQSHEQHKVNNRLFILYFKIDVCGGVVIRGCRFHS
jgi:WD40 repeat protein